MRIFLCGGGDGTQTASAYKKLNEIINHTKPLLYIPLAMESEKYPSCLEWITNELKELNICNIEMVTQASEILNKNLDNYCAIFIGGGNTFKLLKELKTSGAFIKIKQFIKNNGIIFGGSAGAIIFGKNLKSCALDDDNKVGLEDISGFDVLNSYSLLCHYTNRTKEKDEESKKYLLELSKGEKIIALPKVIITKFKNITSEMAFLEGEGDRTLEYYKKAHIDYFKSIEPNFSEETEVIFEIFEVIEDLRNTRLKEKV